MFPVVPHRMSSLLSRTLREDPAGVEQPSQRLLLRAGYLREVSAGLHAWLPLGLRVLRRVEQVVREEWERIGGQEMRLPVLVPAEPYERSGRDAAAGDELLRLRDRRGEALLLAPTHEEIATLLLAGEVSSYRDLPLSLFQIQPKYRDEWRTRSGVLRGREFVMADGYSFDLDDTGLARSYAAYRGALQRILDRLGLRYRVAEARSGAMGGGQSEDFLALSPSGTDTLVTCSGCDYAATVDAASIATPVPLDMPGDAAEPPVMQTLHTPGAPGIADVVAYFDEHLGGGLTAAGMLKCIVFTVDGAPALVLVPGDREVDVRRLADALAPAEVTPFDDFAGRPDLVHGYVGPQGMAERGIPVYADVRVTPGTAWVTGANKADHHVRDAVAGRDFISDQIIEVVAPADGDPCPRCGQPLRVERGIEVGDVHQLGRRYAETFGLSVLGSDGVPVTVTMGCYGVGVSRLVAAVAEQCHDDRGLIWPEAAAPYDVHVVAVGRGEQVERALAVADELSESGLEVLVDDRTDVSAGVKFTDAELLGMPRIVVVGKRTGEGMVELRDRRTGDSRTLPVGELAVALM